MPSDNDKQDIEIIPPDEARRRDRDADWTYISFDASANPFRDMPLHKRILVGAIWLAALVAVALVVFLIVASDVLIWIPLLIAGGIITALVLFFRRHFTRRQ
jgi:uncharacterized YccA/Bax inhibitor family protein